MIKRKLFIIVILFITFMLTVSCGNSNLKTRTSGEAENNIVLDNGDTSYLTNQNLYDIIHQKENEIIQLQEENEQYEYLLDEIIKTLNNDQLKNVSRLQYKYLLTIDLDQKDNLVAEKTFIKHNNFVISFVEKQSSIYLAQNYQNIMNEGKISESLDKHFTVTGFKPSNIYETVEGLTKSINYEYKDVPIGSVIEIKLTDELKERLGLATDFLEVYIKKL